MDKFQEGDRVKVKHSTRGLGLPPGTKGTVVRTGMGGKVIYFRTERGTPYWVKPEDLELDETPDAPTDR